MNKIQQRSLYLDLGFSRLRPSVGSHRHNVHLGLDPRRLCLEAGSLEVLEHLRKPVAGSSWLGPASRVVQPATSSLHTDKYWR